MVDTTLRPRPDFSAFLLSDQNDGKDALSFYNYKKAIRSQKVSLLQQRRATSIAPGYKPGTAGSQHYQKILQKQESKNKSDAETQTVATAVTRKETANAISSVVTASSTAQNEGEETISDPYSCSTD